MDPPAARHAQLPVGTDEPVAPVLRLRAGPLSLAVRGIHLLEVRAHEREILHGAALLFRDTDWLTPKPVVVDRSLAQEEDSFRLVLRGYIPVQPGIDFSVTIAGDREGRVCYLAEAIARADLATNP